MTAATKAERLRCWTDPAKCAPENLPPRVQPDCDWNIDLGASCRAYGPDMRPPCDFPPECEGCARKLRAEGIRGGTITPYQHRVGRRAAA
ncbi:hypothetical protein M2351_006864 [Azospirillum canadense]|nr:hypothetical protein [Azospirillum canadense]